MSAAKRKARPVTLDLPRRPHGRQSPESEAKFQASLKVFCELILEIKSSMDFDVGSRGWCYILEPHGLLKGDFADAQKLITDCRKSGDLPLDIRAEDEYRETVGLQDLDEQDIETQAQSCVDYVNSAQEYYTPFGFWDDLDVYVEVVVEKLDLRNLFAPVCDEFFVPIANFKGWSDLNSRAKMMRRFAAHERAGRKCVLLLCGDHDPGGLRITDAMRRNLEDLARAVRWSPRDLIIIRFGLNADFIDRAGLTWIDNLETASGRSLADPSHKSHRDADVQDYLRRFGVRKCEANALVVAPVIGRDLCRRAILQHVPARAPQAYADRRGIERERLRETIQFLMETR